MICTTRATGSAAIAATLAPGRAFQLTEIRVHLSAAGVAGNLTVNMDSAGGTAYDTNLLTQDMSTVVNLVWQPDKPMYFENGDEVDVIWANASARTYGVEFKYSPL